MRIKTSAVFKVRSKDGLTYFIFYDDAINKLKQEFPKGFSSQITCHAVKFIENQDKVCTEQLWRNMVELNYLVENITSITHFTNKHGKSCVHKRYFYTYPESVEVKI